MEKRNNLLCEIPREHLIVFFLVALSFGTRIIYALLTDNFYEGWDNLVRVEIAYRLFDNPVLIPSSDWVFGHFWMLLFPMWLFNDFEFAPRLISLIPGILFPIPLFYLGKRLFGEFASVIACLLYIFALPQLMLSGSTLTAIPFSFFIITGILFLLKYDETKRTRDILWLALLFMLANSLRLEGWLYSFIIGLYLIFKEKSINKNIILYALITTPPILLFMLDNYTHYNNPFYALIGSDLEVRGAYEYFYHGGIKELMGIMRRSFFAFSGVAFFLGMAGGIVALIKRQYNFIICFFMGTWLLLVYKLINKTLIEHFRYFNTHAIFFYLLAGYFIFYLINLRQCFRIRKFILACIPILFLISIGSDYRAFKKSNFSPLRFPDHYWSFVDRVKEFNNIKKLNVYLDNYNNYNNYVLQYSLQYHARFHARCMTKHRAWMGEIFKISDFFQCISNNDINAIILMPGGSLSRYIADHKSFLEEYFIITEKHTFGEFELYFVEKK